MLNKTDYIASNGESLYFDTDLCVGYLASRAGDSTYDKDYFLNYRQSAFTEIGMALTEARINLVRDNTLWEDKICDVGVGSGEFAIWCNNGYDVNPHAVEFLKTVGVFANPYEEEFDYLCFWDVLEHIDDPREILDRAKKGVFISMPIYRDFNDIVYSKHFKPNEHIWYFSVHGLVKHMLECDFELVVFDKRETVIGRHEIGSFFFRRINNEI